MITKEKLSGMVGEFTWLFGQEFFIETSEGNFIWRNPSYQGMGVSGNIKELMKSIEKSVAFHLGGTRESI